MQTSTTTQAQQKITSFFETTQKSILQWHVTLNKDSFKIENDWKIQSNISERTSMAKHRNVKKMKNYY